MKNNHSFKIKELLHELKHHAPFTAFATISALVLVLVFMYIFQTNISETAFEIAHLLHIIVSSMVTAAIFCHLQTKNILCNIRRVFWGNIYR